MRIATLSIGLAFALVAIYFVVAYGPQLTPFEPLGDYPEQVVTSRVPGIEGPAVLLGEPVLITGTRCSNMTVPITVQGWGAWTARDGLVPAVSIPVVGSGGFRTRAPGCTTNNFVNSLPEGITPGLWRLESFDMATDGERRQVKAYFSQEFKVVARMP